MKERYQVRTIADRVGTSYTSRPLCVNVPGSKSITNRALLIAALSDGTCVLNGAMLSDDSEVFIECLKSLDIDIDVSKAPISDTDTRLPGAGNVNVVIHGCGGRIPKRASVNVGSAGTAARFITALLGLSEGEYDIDSSDQMRKRPMAPLFDALRREGAVIECLEEEGHFPIHMISHGFSGRDISVNIDESSQFLSALLLISVMSDRDVNINVSGSHGMSYIDMTISMMKQFGANVSRISDKDSGNDISVRYVIGADASYTARTYDIEPDMSAAAYFYAMSPLLGIDICVTGTSFDSIQGDLGFIRILEQMGCHASGTDQGIVLAPPGDGILHGLDIDMSSCSDQAITLAAIAPYADSAVTIHGLKHIRLQESDRLTGISAELTRMGIRNHTDSDSITIYPGTPAPAQIETYNDHRMAMGFALTGIKSPGIVINDPGCSAKTFRNYFEILDGITDILTTDP